MGRKKKVCLITPNHICTNPRLIKEATALETHGYAVHVIFTQNTYFESCLDREVLSQHPTWTYDILNWSKKSLKSKFFRATFGLMQKVSLTLFKYSRQNFFSSVVVNRNFFWQVAKAKKIKADLYIAHNLGALPVAQRAARKMGSKFGFDAEDFHRFESTDNILDDSVVIKILAEEKFLSGVNHFTAASPLIAKAYQNLFSEIEPTVILNVFPKPDLKGFNPKASTCLKLFWFSQTIGENRGIEQILEAMSLLGPGSSELHLLGNVNNQFKNKIEQLAGNFGLQSKIIFHPPCPEKEIFNIAATCDVGLASETGFPYNRDICLTNKIFTYIQSGLAVATSNTAAQTDFLSRYPYIGKLYEKTSADSLAKVLRHYLSNSEELKKCKEANLQLSANEMNWEREQEKLINAIMQII